MTEWDLLTPDFRRTKCYKSIKWPSLKIENDMCIKRNIYCIYKIHIRGLLLLICREIVLQLWVEFYDSFHWKGKGSSINKLSNVHKSELQKFLNNRIGFRIHLYITNDIHKLLNDSLEKKVFLWFKDMKWYYQSCLMKNYIFNNFLCNRIFTYYHFLIIF